MGCKSCMGEFVRDGTGAHCTWCPDCLLSLVFAPAQYLIGHGDRSTEPQQ